MSRKAYAKLLNVSGLSVYLWESGRTKPRRETIFAWQDLRKKGARELRAIAGVSAPKRRRTKAKAKAKAKAQMKAKAKAPAAKPARAKKAAKPAKAAAKRPRRMKKRARRVRAGRRARAKAA